MKKVYEPANATEPGVVSAALEAAGIPFLVENEERLLEGEPEPSGARFSIVVIVPETAHAAAREASRRALGNRDAA